MRKLLIIAALACAPLAACATPTNLQPVTYANQTKVDEQLAVGAENAYKLWRVSVKTGVNSGFVKGPIAAKVAEIDNRLYSALLAIEAAYNSGNSASLKSAANSFNAILVEGNAALGQEP